jgi:hypothetical protein
MGSLLNGIGRSRNDEESYTDEGHVSSGAMTATLQAGAGVRVNSRGKILPFVTLDCYSGA